VNVGFGDVLDFEPLGGGVFEVDVDVASGIDDDGFLPLAWQPMR